MNRKNLHRNNVVLVIVRECLLEPHKCSEVYLQPLEKCKKNPIHCKQVLVVTELNHLDAKKSGHPNRVLVVTELVVSGTQVYFNGRFDCSTVC